MAHLATIAEHLDALLAIREFPDYRGALNGVQFANRAPIRRVAAAVDFSRLAIEAAIAADANLLLVHHGMFWGGAQRIVGQAYERVRLLVEHDIAIYGAHLPLDAHATFGNNALLARELGLVPSGSFASYEGEAIGLRGEDDLETALLVERARRLAAAHGGGVRVTRLPEGRRTRRWAVCTGAGASSDTLREAASLGVDTLVVGEGPHHTAVEANDAGLAIVYAGHYATETLGVRALAEHVSSTFGIPWSFLDVPTGL